MAHRASRELRTLVPTGMLGFGFPDDSFEMNLALNPHVIGIDAGSTDCGPHNLGGGIVEATRTTTTDDLRRILTASRSRRIPVVIGSAGTSGSDFGVEWMLDIAHEIARECGWSLRIATVRSELHKDYVKRKLRAGKIRSLGPEEPLSIQTIEETTHIVGLMGVEQIVEALDLEPDLVIAGRSCDAAIFASLAIREGYPKGLAWHMGQILECGAMCSEADHGAAESMTGIIREDRFTVGSPKASIVCSPGSVAAQSFYEESDPARLNLPGGHVWMGNSKFEQAQDGWVNISGSEWRESDRYEVLIEGATQRGYRSITIAGARDPYFISNLDLILDAVHETTARRFSDDFDLDFVVYGRDGVMGHLEPTPIPAHEVGLLIRVVAESQTLADTIIAFVRSSIDHFKYPGIKATAANLAYPLAPGTLSCGPVYEFSVHHLMTLDSPDECFEVDVGSYS